LQAGDRGALSVARHLLRQENARSEGAVSEKALHIALPSEIPGFLFRLEGVPAPPGMTVCAPVTGPQILPPTRRGAFHHGIEELRRAKRSAARLDAQPCMSAVLPSRSVIT
jgi:hypothetical protein